jgi:epoxide hydrolase-like predicted phosphatase
VTAATAPGADEDTGRAIDAVLFDFGGVLTGPVKDSIAAWLVADSIDPASFTATLRAWLSRDAADGTPIHRLETGALSAEEFEPILAAELRTTDGSTLQPAGILRRLFAGIRPDEEMFALAEDLRRCGVRVGLLSNSWGNDYPRERLDALCDDVVISAEVGLRKPQESIYRLATERLGVSADRTLFVDDAEPNILGARAAGLHGVLHRDAATTRAVVAGLVPALEPSEA